MSLPEVMTFTALGLMSIDSYTSFIIAFEQRLLR